MPDIKPCLSPAPLRKMGHKEPWLDWATEMYAHTLAELEMSQAEWEAHFKIPWPGDGYRKTLETQARCMGSEIDDCLAEEG